MRALLVTPIEHGSGETITAVHVAEDLQRAGHDVVFLASAFARTFIEPRLPGCSVELVQDGDRNLALWRRTIAEFAPDVVVFADYPFLFVRRGVVPLGREPGWPEALEECRATLMTLDHFGFAQRPMKLFFGPPHLTPFYYHQFDAIPEHMDILLPCPMHEPQPVPGRRGHTFRYWDVPLVIDPAVKSNTRRQYLDGSSDRLAVHLVPNWAWQVAESLQIELYRYWPELLDHYLGDLEPPVTIVSVNNGRLFDPSRAPRLRIINLPPVAVSEFEALLQSADLILTENRLSISMGKAVCALQNCVALVNRHRMLDLIDSPDPVVRRVVAAIESHRLASVFPFEVFPGGMADLMDEIILYRRNSLTDAFRDVEIFGGEHSARVLRALLVEDQAKADLRSRQAHYVRNLAELPGAAEVIGRCVTGSRAIA
jgi:Family of unknown function (DUF6365)